MRFVINEKDEKNVRCYLHNSVVGRYIFSANADIVSSSKIASTIDSQLQTILQDATSNAKTPVDIWLYETSSIQSREAKIYSEIGISKAQLLTAARHFVSTEKVDEYIMTERTMYANERVEQYALFSWDYPDIQGLNETVKSNTRLFYSQYAPMIRAELTIDEIKLLARDSRVQSIYYSPDISFESESESSVLTINAEYTRDVSNYTGNGVKIGLIEVDGFPDKNKIFLVDSNIIYDPDISETFSNHATRVAAIMVAQAETVNGISYEGIVPDATLYATYYDGGDSDWRTKVEWLLDQGVYVINMSAGNTTVPSNTYGTREK